MQVLIYRENSLQATIEGEDAENQAWIWLLRNQSQSTDWALRYGGWKVRVYPDNEPARDWKPSVNRSPYRLLKARKRKK